MKFIIEIYNNDKFEKEFAVKEKFGASHSRIIIKVYDTETSSVISINVHDLINKYYEIHYYDDNTGCNLHYFKQLRECDLVGLIVYETGFICYVCSEKLKKFVTDRFKITKIERSDNILDYAINLEWFDRNYNVSNFGHLSTFLLKVYDYNSDVILEEHNEYILPVKVNDFYLIHFEKDFDLQLLCTKLFTFCKNDYELSLIRG